jgi:hypothetical protein
LNANFFTIEKVRVLWNCSAASVFSSDPYRRSKFPFKLLVRFLRSSPERMQAISHVRGVRFWDTPTIWLSKGRNRNYESTYRHTSAKPIQMVHDLGTTPTKFRRVPSVKRTVHGFS